uniref:Aminotransferase-like plant mobile domain-containing protein n=1 Tax=Leersia perrieri TaxID=77586 RepID=A0A0D9WUK1_9ORYZ
MASDGDGDELLLVLQRPMEMATGVHRPAHLLPPLAGEGEGGSPPPPPFRPGGGAAESRVSFRGWLGGPRQWDVWVAKLRAIHERLWRHLGIHDAVVASTYRFKRDAALVLHLASFWSPSTSSFAFPWGEATVSLLDVSLLAGLPANGAPVPGPLPPHWRPDEAALNAVRLRFNRSACKKAHHSAWISHFLVSSSDGEIEHAAFLALWLTRFVLPGHPESTMRHSLFPLAVRMARGQRVALAPAVLASLYRDLRDLQAFLSSSPAAADPLSVYAPFYLLQLWAWERFPALRPAKLHTPINPGDPRAARWHDVTNKISPAVLRAALNSGNGFVWLPYTISVHPCGWVRGCHVSGNDALTTLAHCLRACELVGMDCIEQYLPHRVAMQFGLDQDVPGDVPRANDDCVVAWETYHLEGKNVAFFIPQSKPGVTARYARWWRQPLPPSHLDVGAATTALEPTKPSKRKVKKTRLAMEAEEEKERKMKKPRISPSPSSNNDKKRRLQELYRDAKLSDCLAAARNEGDSACDMESENALLTHVQNSNDDIVLLVPKKQTSAPDVNLIKDNNIDVAEGDFKTAMPLVGMEEKDAMLKAQKTSEVDHPTHQLYCPETKAAPSTEIAKDDESSGAVLAANANELDSGRTPDVFNRPEEATSPSQKEGFSDHLSDAVCDDARIKEIVTVDKPPDVSKEPEGGVAVMPEETSSVDQKSLDVSDKPEEGTSIMLELEKEANLSVDESCRVSNSPEDVSATVTGEKEKNVAIDEMDEGNAASQEDVVIANLRAVCSTENVVPESGQDVDAGVINIPHDAMPLPDEVLPVQQANQAGKHIEMPCTMGDINVFAEVQGSNDGEATCDFDTEEQRNLCCIEEIGGENSQMVHKDSEQKPQEAYQDNMVECGQDVNPMENDNVDVHEKIPQPPETVISDSNMTAVCLGVPEAENAGSDKGLHPAKEDTEDMPKEVVGAEGSQQDQKVTTSTQDVVVDEHNKVAELDHIIMAEPNVHAQCDGEKPEEVAEEEHAEMDGSMIITGRGTDGVLGVPEAENEDVDKDMDLADKTTEDMPKEVVEVVGTEMKHIDTSANGGAEAELKDAAEVEDIDMAEPKLHAHFDTVKPEKVTGVRHAEMDETEGQRQTGRDTDKMSADVPDVGHSEVEKDNGLRDNTTCEKSAKQDEEAEEVNGSIKDDAENKSGKLSELESTGMGGTHGPLEEVTDSNLEEVPDVHAQAEQVNGLERDDDGTKGILQVDIPARDEAGCLAKEDAEDNTTEVPLVNHENVRDKAPIEKDTVEKHTSYGNELGESEVDEFNEIIQVRQVEGEECKVSREKDTEENAVGIEQIERQGNVLTEKCKYEVEQVDEQSERLTMAGVEEKYEEITQAQENEFDNNMMETSKVSVNSEMLCNSASIQSGEQKEASDEGMTDMQCIQAVEFVDEREPFSDAAAMIVEGADDHRTTNTHEDVATKQIQDCGIICENKDTQMLQDGCALDIGLKSDIDIMEIEPQAIEGIQNKETMELDKQQEMEDKQNPGTTTENSKMEISEEDANTLSSGDTKPDPPNTNVSEVEFTTGIQNQEHLDIKKAHIMDQESKFRPLEEADTSCACGDGEGNIAVSLDVNGENSIKGMRNEEIHNTEEASVLQLQAKDGKQHNGAHSVNEKRILENTSTIDSGDSTNVGVNGAESREGTQSLCVLNTEKEPEILEDDEEDWGTENENAKQILVNTDSFECGEVKPDAMMKMTHETLLDTGDTSSPKDQHKDVPWEDHNKSDSEVSESNQTATKESERAIPAELEDQAEVREGNMDNKTEMSLGRENDEVCEQDQTSTEEPTIAPSSMDDRGENSKGWSEESVQNYGRYASDQVNTSWQPVKFGKPSIEEVKRTHSGRSIYLRDIKESQGRTRSETSNKLHLNTAGHYSRHAVPEPVSVSKEIKVPLYDSTRASGRDRGGPELVVTGPPEETSRWRQEQYALQILEDVQNARIAEKTRMEMEIRILKAQVSSMQRQAMSLDRVGDGVSRSRRH